MTVAELARSLEIFAAYLPAEKAHAYDDQIVVHAGPPETELEPDELAELLRLGWECSYRYDGGPLWSVTT